MVKDPLLSKVSLKALPEIIAAARETIHRHRRRFIQRNLRPCPFNCKKTGMLDRCADCGSQGSEKCIKEDRFVPIYTKDELARQFADQLRNPEVLLREYRDITVFLWVLGAFDKQQIDKEVVSGIESHKAAKKSAGEI
jgi:hypothetical protein